MQKRLSLPHSGTHQEFWGFRGKPGMTGGGIFQRSRDSDEDEVMCGILKN